MRKLTIIGPGCENKDFVRNYLIFLLKFQEICSICMLKLNENPQSINNEQLSIKSNLVNKKKKVPIMVSPCNH